MSLSIAAFFLNIALYTAASALVFANTGKSESRVLSFLKNRSRFVLAGGTVLSLILLVLDITGTAGMSGYRFLAFVDLAAFAAAWFTGSGKIPAKYSSHAGTAVRIILVSLALEIFVFNINSAHLLSGKYSKVVFDLHAAELQNFDPVTMTNEGSGQTVIEYKNVNIPVGTLTFNAFSDKKSRVSFSVDMSDDTHSGSYRWGAAKAEVINGNRRSRTVPCNFSGNVHDIRFVFSTDENEKVTVSSITANEPVRFRFSVIRFALMLLSAFIVYSLTSEKVLFRPYAEVQKITDISALAFTAVIILLGLFIANMGRYTDENHSMAKDFALEGGNQITQELVDSFEHGRVDIMTDMNPKLLELGNPYDWSQRTDEVGSYPWDHLLFNGKYYSYYGIAPVLLVFLPYHLLTGYYFPSVWAVFFFGMFGTLFLTKFYLCLADKFFRNISASLVLSGFFIMQLSSGILICNISPLFYEIAQSAGFLCTAAGAYFLISSNVLGEGKINKFRLAVSGIWLSLGVLSRPTIAVYCLAAMLLVYAGAKKQNALYDKKSGKSRVVFLLPYLAAALVPYIVIGSVQAWYNAARFGNPLDFGIQYSLTINDFTRSEYHTHFAVIGFLAFLFQMPVFTEYFPFFKAESIHLFDAQGYYFIATGAALGLIWKALPVAAYSASFKAYRLTENRNRTLYSLIILSVCIICPFAVIFSIWESGFAARYCVDFIWQMITGALVICFIVYSHCASNTKVHLNRLMTASLALSVVMNLTQIWSYVKPEEGFSTEWQANMLSFARLFEFWR
ncbi:hypothetical protein [Ruminococcus sp. HUN007]|uniref:hypothetical protein n=1 Tax=Ruminococcus sp. HUN007 TaxID=1514668 RepID=UPI0005D27D44|nr:hypothetical protein [Ruminococcus sp. HUN007]